MDSRLRARARGNAVALSPRDISKEADAKRISEAAVRAFGAIDILVNNAADFTTKSVEDATLEDWHACPGR